MDIIEISLDFTFCHNIRLIPNLKKNYKCTKFLFLIHRWWIYDTRTSGVFYKHSHTSLRHCIRTCLLLFICSTHNYISLLQPWAHLFSYFLNFFFNFHTRNKKNKWISFNDNKTFFLIILKRPIPYFVFQSIILTYRWPIVLSSLFLSMC